MHRFAKLPLSSAQQRIVAILSLLSVIVLIITTGLFINARQAQAQTGPTYRFQDSHFYKLGLDDAQYSDNTAALQNADNLAYPAASVAPSQIANARNAANGIFSQWGSDDPNQGWQLVGPTTTPTSQYWSYTGNASTISGRITTLGVGSNCDVGNCRFYVGAAGGGVWTTEDALAKTPSWKSVSQGLFTNAIGSIWVDPHNSRHVLVGTGEQNGSSDSEAGLGLFETWDAGNLWVPLSGSFAVAGGRAIGAIAIDPNNSAHIFIGTAVARHGASSVIGGRYTPPKAPQVGLYESKNGGRTFSLAFSEPSDSVDPTSANGSDFFRGGVSKILYDPTTAGRIYFSMFDYGLFRSNGHSGYEQAFASAGGGSVATSATSRTEFALAPHDNGQLRIYLGDLGSANADFYRVDNADVAASALTNGASNPGWLKLSNPNDGTPGYASYNFCEGQCSYDMVVASPAGHPDTVYLGGSFAYGELNRNSNARAVQRSTNLGVGFTDMTNDASFNGLHPDQHALVFDPENPNIIFTGSDGGLVRDSGTFTNQAIDPNFGCAARGLTGVALVDCNAWLSAVPTHNFSLNAGLATLQFQSVSVNPSNVKDVQGGTQDNGTLLRQGTSSVFNMQVGGDGGQSGYNVANPNIRFHSYFAPQHDVSFSNGAPLSWDWISDPLLASGEAASFYTPIIADPKVGGTMFDGLQHVWRTQDNGGPQAYLDTVCNEFTGTLVSTCGDWQPLGGANGDLSGAAWGTDKGGTAPTGNYVAAITRAPSNAGTMWVATRRGRLFISTNADTANAADVAYNRIDTANTPTRFISGITVDKNDPNHAFVSFSGYDAYSTATNTATGHVFDVHYNSATKTATWKDISSNLGDQPVTGIQYDAANHALYIATDYSVLRLRNDGHWRVAASGLPLVAVYGLTLAPQGNVLYAATHGRGIYTLNLNREHDDHPND